MAAIKLEGWPRSDWNRWPPSSESAVEEVAPLEATISGVDKAAELVDSGHYYEANQALKSVEDGIRFDSDVLSAKADKAAKPPHA